MREDAQRHQASNREIPELATRGLFGLKSVSTLAWDLQGKALFSSPGTEVFQFLPPICLFSLAAASSQLKVFQAVEKPAPQASLWIILCGASLACNFRLWDLQSLELFLMWVIYAYHVKQAWRKAPSSENERILWSRKERKIRKNYSLIHINNPATLLCTFYCT